MPKKPPTPTLLFMIIRRKFFDQVRAGTKTEEYRAFSDFWTSRLAVRNEVGEVIEFRHYNVVRFQNGYAKNAPVMEVEFKETTLGEYMDVPKDSPDRFGFAILPGKLLHVKND